MCTHVCTAIHTHTCTTAVSTHTAVPSQAHPVTSAEVSIKVKVTQGQGHSLSRLWLLYTCFTASWRWSLFMQGGLHRKTSKPPPLTVTADPAATSPKTIGTDYSTGSQCNLSTCVVNHCANGQWWPPLAWDCIIGLCIICQWQGLQDWCRQLWSGESEMSKRPPGLPRPWWKWAVAIAPVALPPTRVGHVGVESCPCSSAVRVGANSC